MLRIEIPETEVFNERDNTFQIVNETSITLEHSLVSLSKWESKWCTPFLSKYEKSTAETLDYIKFMTLTQNVDDSVYARLTDKNYEEIKNYIESPMTATTIGDKKKKPSREIITAEIIYYWMIALGIPFECQKWHLNRLLTLISVCSIKQQKPTKMSKKELMAKNQALNAERKAALGTSG